MRVTRALLTALIGLGGCTLDEPAPGIDIAVPPAYRAADGKAAAPPVTVDWPSLFRSAELTRLARQAAAQNLDIAAAVARIVQADAQARIDAAALFPTLTGTASAQRQQTPGTLGSTAPSRGRTSNLFQFGLTASYEIDFFGKNQATAEAGRLAAQASRYDSDVVTLSTVATLADDYLLVLGAQDRLRLAADDIKTAERVLDAIRARLSVGTATALDVAQQESVVATQRAAVPPLKQQVLQTKNLIAVLLGRTPESVGIRGGSLDALAVPPVRAGLPSALLLRRPDVVEAETQLAAAQQSVVAARAALFPSIALTGSGGFESALLKNLLRPEAAFGSIAASLTQPLLDGYALEGQLDLQRGRRTELLEDYRKAVISAFSDVENALIAVQQTGEHERLQALAVAASRRAQDITEQRLREGTIDIVTLLMTEQTLFQAQDELSQVRLQRLQAYVSLFQALGGGFTPAVEAPAPGPSIEDALTPVPVKALEPPLHISP